MPPKKAASLYSDDEEDSAPVPKRRSMKAKAEPVEGTGVAEAAPTAAGNALFDESDGEGDVAVTKKPVRLPPRLKKSSANDEVGAAEESTVQTTVQQAPQPPPAETAQVETPSDLQQSSGEGTTEPNVDVSQDPSAPPAEAVTPSESQPTIPSVPAPEESSPVESQPQADGSPSEVPPQTQEEEKDPYVIPKEEDRPSAQFGLAAPPEPEPVPNAEQPETPTQNTNSIPVAPQPEQQPQGQMANQQMPPQQQLEATGFALQPGAAGTFPQQQPVPAAPQQQGVSHTVPSMASNPDVVGQEATGFGMQPNSGVAASTATATSAPPSLHQQQMQQQQQGPPPQLAPPVLNQPVQFPPPGVNPFPPTLQQQPGAGGPPPGLPPPTPSSSGASGQVNYMMASPSPALPQPTPIANPALIPLPGHAEPPIVHPVRDEEGNPGVPPLPQPLDITADYQVEAAAQGDAPAWNAFCEVQKKLVDAHKRTTELHEQLGKLQLSHEKEAADVQVKAQFQIDALKKELQTTQDHYNECQAKLDTLTSLLHRKAEQILRLEQEVVEAKKVTAQANQIKVQTEDKLKIAESARQVAEVRQQELELSMEHSTTLVNSLRQQLYGANDDKVAALTAQYNKLEENRQQLIAYYTQREAQLLLSYNGSLRGIQAQTDEHIKQREKEIASEWQKTIASLTAQYKALEAEVLTTSSRHQQEKADWEAKSEYEREKWISHLKDEMVALETRHSTREEQVLVDIARRERELAEREAQTRVQMAKEQQEAKLALLAREAELKAYYENIVEGLHKAHATDREKLMSDFRDQVGSLSRQHESNERELERLHRDKEREMAQRYRIAGYEVDDKRKEVEMQNVTNKTQTSLLSRMENMERNQRERADVSRNTLKGEGVTTLSDAPTAGSPTGSTTSLPRSSTLGSAVPDGSGTASRPLGTNGPLDTAGTAPSTNTSSGTSLLDKLAAMEKAQLGRKD